MRRALQQQFQAKEEATGASPTLSVDDLTAAMTKREAARIFYQICGKLPTACFVLWAEVYACLCICLEKTLRCRCMP